MYLHPFDPILLVLVVLRKVRLDHLQGNANFMSDFSYSGVSGHGVTLSSASCSYIMVIFQVCVITSIIS